jgi:hypothetical protein
MRMGPRRPEIATIGRCAAALLAAVFVATDAAPQGRLTDWLKRIPSVAVSEEEAGRGVKEALAQGVTRAVINLNRTDGFFGSDLYKVLLPPDARKAETAMRRMGLGGQVDRAVLAINRGAEDAVGTAAPIFTGAITRMTIRDAIGIVRGNADAATQYFRQKTAADLTAAFTPSVKTSLDRTHATKHYADIANTFNRFPLTTARIDPDLTAYVVGEAVDALFDQVAREEARIRANPAARTTAILEKVFGTPWPAGSGHD